MALLGRGSVTMTLFAPASLRPEAETMTLIAGRSPYSEKMHRAAARRLFLAFVALLLAAVAAACSGSEGSFDGSQLERDDGAEGTPVPAVAAPTPKTFGTGAPGEMVVGFQPAADHPIVVEVLNPFFASVGEGSGGNITFDVYPDAEIVQGALTYQGVIDGTHDIGWGQQVLTAGRFPATSAVELPFIFSSATEATDVLWTLYDDYFELRDEYLGVKLLGIWARDPGYIWTTTADASGIGDVEGLALGVPGPIQQDLVVALGAIPAPLLPSEIQGAFQADEIDGVLASASTMSALGLAADVESGIACRCAMTTEFLVMDQAEYDALPPEQQAVIDDNSGRQLSLAAAETYDRNASSALAEIEAAGGDLTTLDDDAMTEWSSATQSVVDGWIAAGEDTRLPTAAMYDRMVMLVEGG